MTEKSIGNKKVYLEYPNGMVIIDKGARIHFTQLEAEKLAYEINQEILRNKINK